jgi:hypothetical protein
MAKRNWLFIGSAIVLVGVYFCFFTNWFRPRPIEVFYASRFNVKPRNRWIAAANANTEMVFFGLGHSYKLTEIKVVRLDDWKTNSFALPLWHLISDSNSIPVKLFPYGQPIRGMKPVLARQRPKPLEPNVTYRIFIAAGPAEGAHDFTTLPKRPGGR